MEVRAEHFKKVGSIPSDAPIETWMISTYWRENTYRIIKTKILRHFFHQQNNLTRAYFLGRKLKPAF